MDWVETTGQTLAAAKASALDVLGVEETDVEIEVLDEGRSSFLGIGGRPARVRARLKPSYPAPKRDAKRGRRRKPPSTKPSRDNEAVASQQEGPRGKEESMESGETPQEESVSAKEPVSRIELATAAQEFLAGLLREFGVPGEVVVASLDDDSMELEINGEALGTLVGPRGSVMTAVQEVTRLVVQGRSGERTGRVSVDIAGYRKRRKQALEEFTHSQAKIVLETGQERAFEAMSASDRKVIHDTAAEIPGVISRSEGEEPERYVVLSTAAQESVDLGEDEFAEPVELD